MITLSAWQLVAVLAFVLVASTLQTWWAYRRGCRDTRRVANGALQRLGVALEQDIAELPVATRKAWIDVMQVAWLHRATDM